LTNIFAQAYVAVFAFPDHERCRRFRAITAMRKLRGAIIAAHQTVIVSEPAAAGSRTI
jgi:hypothetical protein